MTVSVSVGPDASQTTSSRATGSARAAGRPHPADGARNRAPLSGGRGTRPTGRAHLVFVATIAVDPFRRPGIRVPNKVA